MSFGPPGGNGTIRFIGFVGKSSAAAAQGSSRHSTIASRREILMQSSSPYVFFMATANANAPSLRAQLAGKPQAIMLIFLPGIVNEITTPLFAWLKGGCKRGRKPGCTPSGDSADATMKLLIHVASQIHAGRFR